MTAWLAAARATHYAACAGLFGLALFQLYAVQPPRLRGWFAGLALTALISGAAWLGLVTLNLAGSLDRETLAAVIGQTSFGLVWVVRLALATATLALACLAPGRLAVGLTAGAVLASIALTGHTQTHEGALQIAHVAADAAHLLGAGAWMGGLLGLALSLTPGRWETSPVTVARFSRMAYFAVAGLIASGLINAAVLVGSPAGLIGSAYGRLLLLKLALFAGMLSLAGVNRLRVSPRLAGPDGPRQMRQLRRNALMEQGLGLGVLICVAALGLGQPPA